MGAVVTTVILNRSGLHHATLQQCTPEDATRWADEGYLVFQLAAQGRGQWAVYQVNEGKLFTSNTPPTEPDAAERAGSLVRLLTDGRKG